MKSRVYLCVPHLLTVAFSLFGCQQQDINSINHQHDKVNVAESKSNATKPTKALIVLSDLDKLQFANPNLEQQAEYFHELAEKTAEKDWFVQRYRDVKIPNRIQHIGTWQTKEYHKSYYLKSILPFRSVSILVEGKSGEEKLDTVSAQGRWVPELGWAASVNFSSESGAECWVMVGLVQQSYSDFSFDMQDAAPVIRLSQNFVSAKAEQKPTLHVRYQAHLPHETSPEAETKRRQHFWALFKSPESMRDTVLADLDQLRLIAKDQIDRSENLTVFDMKGVRSDNPPREAPDFKHQVSDSTKLELLKQILAKLDAQEVLVRENFKEIHAAMQKALRLDKSKLL